MSTLNDKVKTLLAKPSLNGLVYALEHSEVWPESYAETGFHWKSCGTCALGLASALWGMEPSCDSISIAMSVPHEACEWFFIWSGTLTTTPADVADTIRKWQQDGFVPYTYTRPRG